MTTRLHRYRVTLGTLIGGISALTHSTAHLVGDVADHIAGLPPRAVEDGPEGEGEDYVPGSDTPLDSLAQLDHNATAKRGELHESDNKMRHRIGFTAGRK